MTESTLNDLEKLPNFAKDCSYDVTAYKEDGSVVSWMNTVANVASYAHRIVLSVPVPITRDILVSYISEANLIKRIEYDICNEQGDTIDTVVYNVEGISDWSIESKAYLKSFSGYKVETKITDSGELEKVNNTYFPFRGSFDSEILTIKLEFIGEAVLKVYTEMEDLMLQIKYEGNNKDGEHSAE